MTPEVVLALGLLVLAFLSGMLGLGVAFAAIPFLSFFLEDLVHQVQPLALLLNGLTALLSTLGFAEHWETSQRKGKNRCVMKRDVRFHSPVS
jgi:hypothetical protein